MNVKIEKEGSLTRVYFEGRVDTACSAQFQQDLAPLMEGANPNIDIDCTNMDYTSSQGLRIILGLQKSVSSRGGHLVMRNMKPQVKEVFDITGFASIIDIE